MFAEVAINIESGLEQSFHYAIPSDLRSRIAVGHLIEIEFGSRLAQGIIVALDENCPVPDPKPIISIIDPVPVVLPQQVELARWLSETYLAPLNGCFRLMLPPGVTRWSDVTLGINPYWNGTGILTGTQEAVIALLREHRDLRGRQLRRLIPKKFKETWQPAVRQLVRRDILVRGTVLDPPRIRPKKVTTATLIIDPYKLPANVLELGRPSKKADLLYALMISKDPLPTEKELLKTTNCKVTQLEQLAEAGLIQRTPAVTVKIDSPNGVVEHHEPAYVGLAIRPKQFLEHLLALRGAKKYYAVLLYLAHSAQARPLTAIYEAAEANRKQIDQLAQLEWIQLGSEISWRNSLADKAFTPADAPTLTKDQLRLWHAIERMPFPPKPILLHGVTGSGKTEIYMKAIDRALQKGQRAIVLVPEIALTPQTVRRFSARFPGRVAILHSSLTDGERYDTWGRARRGLIDIVIGPRSALFAPLPNLGVIIVDEEHDDNYRQEPPIPPPYYHAREVAIVLGRIWQATVILGSATPDLVSYHRANAGELHLLTLGRRVMGHRLRIASQEQEIGRASHYQSNPDDPQESLTISLPPIELVDMRQELRAGNRSIFSRVLQTELDKVLERREQAILFLNRRGSATYVFCRDCGHSLKCPDCEMPLIFHHQNAQLICHHCGYKQPQPSNCPKCQSTRIKYFGLGTEQLEQIVQEQWPTSRIVRWDQDTTQEVASHDLLLAKFIDHEADLLIGTQMIAKGLDLPLVTLVGVISADMSLNLPDYRNGERTFQLLTQVAGRAGRGLLEGRVIFQTYQPEHYAIRAAAKHDYTTFYQDELEFRTQHRFPPFCRIAKLVIADPVFSRAEYAAKQLAAELRAQIRHLELDGTELVGPLPPFFQKIDRRYRWQILIKSADPGRLLRAVSISSKWDVEIDPTDTL